MLPKNVRVGTKALPCTLFVQSQVPAQPRRSLYPPSAALPCGPPDCFYTAGQSVHWPESSVMPTQDSLDRRVEAILYKENHALDAWFKKAYGGEQKSCYNNDAVCQLHEQSNRKVFYKAKRTVIGKILRELCEWKGEKIIETEACPDHIHLFVEIPPKYSVSGFMGCLKGKVLRYCMSNSVN